MSFKDNKPFFQEMKIMLLHQPSRLTYSSANNLEGLQKINTEIG
jgi:hypothetical protein